MIAETRKHTSVPANVAGEPQMDTTSPTAPGASDEAGTAEAPPPAAAGETSTAGAEPAADALPPARSAGRRELSGGQWALLAAVIAAAIFVVLRLTGGPETVEGPDGMDRPVPVRATAVTAGDLDVFSSYPGELVGEVSDIAPRVGGLLQEVPVRIGDRVARGAVLAVVDDVNLRNQFQEAKGQLGVAQANQRRSAAELDSVAADHRRAVDLHRERLLSEQEFERVEAQLASGRATLAASEAQTAQAEARLALLEQQLQDSRVVAPFSGTVAARYLDRGAMVQAGTPILRLVEAAPLLVQFRVPERDLGAVRPGATFTVATQATGETFAGIVRRVSGEVSRNDRAAVVEGELPESSDLLKPGMYAEVQVRVRALEGALLVPDVALLERVTMGGVQTTGVFRVAAGEGEVPAAAQWTPVEVAGRSRGMAAVTGSLAAGDLVLTLGHSELHDGGAIRVVQETEPATGGGAAETAP